MIEQLLQTELGTRLSITWVNEICQYEITYRALGARQSTILHTKNVIKELYYYFFGKLMVIDKQHIPETKEVLFKYLHILSNILTANKGGRTNHENKTTPEMIKRLNIIK